MAEIPGNGSVGTVVRRYCRARLAPVCGVGRADEVAAALVAEVATDPGVPFGTEAYRAAARAVDRAIAASRPEAGPGHRTPLSEAVEDLPAPIRDVLVLRALVGLTRAQVAGILGVSDRT